MPRPDKACESMIGCVAIPKLLPVGGAHGVFAKVVLPAEALREERDGIVVGRGLHILGGGTIGALNGQIAQLLPVIEIAASFLQRMVGVLLGVMDYSLIGSLPIDARQVFQKSIRDGHVGVAAALHAAIVISTARIGQPALMTIEIHKTANDATFALLRNQCEQRT